MIIEVEERGVEINNRRKSVRRIHYEDMWSSYDAYKKIIKHEWSMQGVWTDVNPVQLFKKSANTTMAQPRIWSRKEFGERTKQLKSLRNELQRARQSNIPYVDGAKIRKIEKQIDKILDDEEIYWK